MLQNPAILTAAATVITLLASAFNSWLFWRLRAEQLQQRIEIMKEVEDKFVRKPEPVYPLAHGKRAHA